MKKFFLIYLLVAVAMFVACDSKTSKGVLDNVMGKDSSEVKKAETEELAAFAAFDELIGVYKVKVNGCTTCAAVDQCQLEFTRDFNALITDNKDIANELHVKSQHGVTELGSLMNKKKTELGCNK